MSTKFNVEIEQFKKINKLTNDWNSDDYIMLLESMELGDDDLKTMSESDLKEMTKMSLADFEPEEAANFVLMYLIQDELTHGKIDQISHEMTSDRLWEQFADLSLHERFFKAYGLLREAFNGIFADPTGVELSIKISLKHKDDFKIFETSIKPAVTRLLAAGMDENAIINRLYNEKIVSDNFREAENILWQINEVSKSDSEVIYEVVSSEFWLGDLENVKSYEAKTHADNVEDDE